VGDLPYLWYNLTMESLLRELLSDTVALRFKAQGYHWNVEGINFHQFHDLFSDIYNVYESGIDPLAEWLRKLGYLAPSDLLSFYNESGMSESIASTKGIDMVVDLQTSNYDIERKFRRAVSEATAVGEHALANFFAERLDAHQKINWQLVATAK
jgi:starvation-inducible DNA-binding protein